MREYINMGFGQLRAYDFFVNLGSVLGSIIFIVLCYQYRKKIMLTVKIYICMLIVVLCGSVAGSVLRGLTYGEVNGFTGFIGLFTSFQGDHFLGRVLFTIVIFPTIFTYLFRNESVSKDKYMDMLCIFFGIQHIFNRIGCWFNGCCFGKYYEGFLAMKYQGIGGSGPAVSYPVYPTQPFEIFAMILLCLIMVTIYSKKKPVVPVFEMGFGLVIFISEFMMNLDGTRIIVGLTIIQYAAILLIGMGVWKMCKRRQKGWTK